LSGNNGKKWRAPKHLKPTTRRWAEQIAEDYLLESHHHRLLVLAGEALDRGEQARILVEREGAVVPGRFGPKAHPAVLIERDQKTLAARLFRELGLEDGRDDPRPPRVRHGV
jgi:hypothetical protein